MVLALCLISCIGAMWNMIKPPTGMGLRGTHVDGLPSPRGNGAVQRRVRREHPMVAMTMTPRRHNQSGKSVK